ncbi:MAG: response regulator transcription factor [Actinomycetota bacterium]|nr:response regulator transcription factor [Actinomycetota bacterium]
MNGDPARVFVVAPTPFARAGLRSILESAEVGADVLVVGEADSVVELVPPGADVVVVVAGDDPLEEAARAVAEEGTQAILLLSEDDRSVPVLREFAPRGWGVVSPDAPPEELSAAIVAVIQGLVVLPRALTGRLLRGQEVVEEPGEPLTAREREVLGLLGRGLSNKMIARDLRISEHTVKFHVSSIYAKLGAASRTEAVGLGARLGLISL